MNRTEANSLFHRLWTKAVDTDGYVKKDWQALEEVVNRKTFPPGPPEELAPGRFLRVGDREIREALPFHLLAALTVLPEVYAAAARKADENGLTRPPSWDSVARDAMAIGEAFARRAKTVGGLET